MLYLAAAAAVVVFVYHTIFEGHAIGLVRAAILVQIGVVMFIAHLYSRLKFSGEDDAIRKLRTYIVAAALIAANTFNQWTLADHFDFSRSREQFILRVSSEDSVTSSVLSDVLQEQLSTRRARFSSYRIAGLAGGGDFPSDVSGSLLRESGNDGFVYVSAERVLSDAGYGFRINDVQFETLKKERRTILDSSVPMTRKEVSGIYEKLAEELNLSSIEPRALASLSEFTEANAYYIDGIGLLNSASADSLRRARDLFIKAIRVDRNFVLAKIRAAESFTQLYISGWELNDRNLSVARDLLKEAEDRDPSMPAVFVAQAKQAAAPVLANYYAGNYVISDPREDMLNLVDEAIDLANRATAIDSDNYSAHSELIRLHLLRGHIKQAHNAFANANSICRDCPSAYLREGAVLMEEHRYDEAISMFEQYITRRPDHGAGYYNLACTYSLMGLCGASQFYLEEACRYTDFDFHRIARTDRDLRKLRDCLKARSHPTISMR